MGSQTRQALAEGLASFSQGLAGEILRQSESNKLAQLLQTGDASAAIKSGVPIETAIEIAKLQQLMEEQKVQKTLREKYFKDVGKKIIPNKAIKTNAGKLQSNEVSEGIAQDKQPQVRIKVKDGKFYEEVIPYEDTQAGKLDFERAKLELKKEYSSPDSPEGLTSEQQVQARALAKKIYGVRGAEKGLPSIYAEMKAGKTIDEIEDSIRYAGQSKEMTGAFRNSIQTAMINSSEGKAQQAMDFVDDLLSQGDIDGAKQQIKRIARVSSGTEEQRAVNGKERTLQLVNEIGDDLKKLEANGISTNIFAGKTEDIMAKVGQVKSPELRQIATKIAIAVQNYRRSMSGVAFSVPETKEYKAIFPNIDKVGKFNVANINALKDVLSGDLDTFYSLAIGDSNYKKLFKEKQARAEKQGDVPEWVPQQYAEKYNEALKIVGGDENKLKEYFNGLR